jgi:predicted DNA-binding protein (UPF0278 family)
MVPTAVWYRVVKFPRVRVEAPRRVAEEHARLRHEGEEEEEHHNRGDDSDICSGLRAWTSPECVSIFS